MSRDGKLLAVAGDFEDFTIRIWNVDTGKCLHIVELDKSVLSIQNLLFSPDGSILVSTHHDQYLRFWDTKTGKLIRQLYVLGNDHGEVNPSSLTFSNDGKKLVVGTVTGCIRQFDVASGREIEAFTSHREPLRQVQFFGDKDLRTQGLVRQSVWDTTSWKELSRINRNAQATEYFVDRTNQILSPDGKVYLQVNENIINLNNTITGKLIRQIDSKGWDQIAGHFTPDGKKVLITADDGKGGVCSVYSASTGDKLADLRLNLSEAQPERTLSPDGGKLFWLDTKSDLQIADVESSKVVRSFKGIFSDDAPLPAICGPSVSPGGDFLAALFAEDFRANRLSDPGFVRVYDIGSGLELGRVEIKAGEKSTAEVKAMALSPDGRFLAVCQREETFVRIFDVLAGREIRRLKGHLDSIVTLDFSPDGKVLASGSNDTTAYHLGHA